MMWLLRIATASNEADEILAQMIEAICELNVNSTGLPDPYHDLAEVVIESIRQPGDPRRGNFQGRSYTLKSLVQLFARRRWRQRLRFLWPDISRLSYVEFTPESPSAFCKWINESGALRVTQPHKTQRWEALKDEADRLDASIIPQTFQDSPESLLLFILVYPHRLTANVAKYLDNQIIKLVRGK